MPCYKIVVTLNCPYCQGAAIKFGKVGMSQRYRCKTCKSTFMDAYINKACHSAISKNIVDHLKEGCGIRSIARLLAISAVTVLRRIKSIADEIKKPMILTGRIYEVDELKTKLTIDDA